MIAAGSGIAPFRGFIQERAVKIGLGQTLPPALLFYGCREPGKDDLYSEELAKWEKLGAVKVYYAYSRVPEKAGGHKYVQDTLWAEKATVNEIWQAGARLYVCGSRHVGKAVSQMMVTMHLDNAESTGETMTEEDAKEWWESLRNERYSIEVFD